MIKLSFYCKKLSLIVFAVQINLESLSMQENCFSEVQQCGGGAGTAKYMFRFTGKSSSFFLYEQNTPC